MGLVQLLFRAFHLIHALFKGLDDDDYGRGRAAAVSEFEASALTELSASVRRFAPVPLKPDSVDVSAQPLVMVSNQYPRSFQLKDVLVEVGSVQKLWDAASTDEPNEEDNLVAVAAHIYNPEALASNPYEAVVTSSTPGFRNTIQPYQGFYVKLQGAALNAGAKATLWIPQVE